LNEKGQCRVRAFSEKYGMDIDPRNSPITVRQRKADGRNSEGAEKRRGILVLDEPTAVLTPQEIVKLFRVLRKMRDDDAPSSLSVTS
jgi:ABC-type uncharacterized transport system ATPase subunit